MEYKVSILNIKNHKTAKEVLSLQKKSYSIEAEIINFDKLPPLLDSIETLINTLENYIGIYIEQCLVGFLSYKINENILDIHRLAVSPDHFNQGIATSLLKYLENFPKIKTIIVSTGYLNTPAIRLYEKNGFILFNIETVEEGLKIAQLKKHIY